MMDIMPPAIVRIALLLTFLLFCVNCASLPHGSPEIQSISPPEGWRFPEKKDISGYWSRFKDDPYTMGFKSGFPYHVTSDFNGDGINDHAWLMIGKNGRRWGVFVFTPAGKAYRIYKLVEYKDWAGPQAAYLSLASRELGRIKTACGKGYFECEKDEPEEVVLDNDSIYFGFPETTHFLVYWNRGKNRFSLVAISD